LSDVFRSFAWRLSLLAVVAVWVVDPFVDALMLGEGTWLQQLFHPEAAEIYFRSTLSLLILLIGVTSTVSSLRVLSQKQALMMEREKLSQVIQFAPECVKTVARDGTLMEMNPAGLNIVEADSLGEVQGQSVYDLIAPEHRQLYIDFNARIFAGKSEQIEYDVIGLKGTRKSVESHAVPLHDNDGKVIAHLAMTRDITRAKQMAARLSYQASHDLLTGLINRHEFERRVETSLALAITDKSTHAVFFIDADQFKVINDTCGHLAGDQLLKQLGEIIRDQVRQQDSVARLGGDEFAVLLQYCAEIEARELAEKLRSAIDEFNFPWEGRQFKVTASIGVVIFDQSDAQVSDILRDADTACYMAKEQGRNRIQEHRRDDDVTARHQGEMHWVSTIHEGIEERRFVIVGQVIEALADDEHSRHVELLIRYRNEDGSLAPPGAFLPAAERYGISAKLDRYVLVAALEHLQQMPELLQAFNTFSLNLSGLTLGDSDFLPFACEQMASFPELSGRICFEITETAAISNLQRATQFIERLQSLGCRFALDDFGSGLSSFGYLKNLPVDYVKIDGSFVRDMADDPIDLAMVRSINELAHLMGKRTVAEFVEDDACKQLLKRLGVDFAQGYGVAKPMPLAELVAQYALVSQQE
jgi:diguanylate cyclase (GGDEF)-like protein/PAS domain S-box-containing protein